MAIAAELACKLDAMLGEGPIWSPPDRRLYFVDIKQGRIHAFDPARDALESFDVGGSPSFFLRTTDGGFVFGDGNSLFRFADGARQAAVFTIDQPAANRMNDACADRSGRLWFGTMDDREAIPTGRFWRYDRAPPVPTDVTAIVTNGPAIGGDGRTLYTVDTFARRIDRHGITAEGALIERRPFVQLSEADGYPDGITVDAEDCLWVGLWDGWGVRRYDPSGRLIEQVRLPCARATKLAFGGGDGRTAYVTTARIGLSAAELGEQPLAGSLFRFEAPCPGAAAFPVGLAGSA